MSADLELQKAIYERLMADTDLASILAARIYDNVPGDTSFPYVTLGEAQVSDWSTDDSAGLEHQLVMHAYSRGGGRMEAKSIIGAIVASLHDSDLTLETYRLINLRLSGTDIMREADGTTWRGTVRFRAVTEPIEA